MQFKGTAHRYGRDVDTDVIIPARYLNTSDPAELAKHCLEDLDKSFIERVQPGDIIVADENFGCGSSREHAPIAIKAAGVDVVVAKSFARIFYRNSINTGRSSARSSRRAASSTARRRSWGSRALRRFPNGGTAFRRKRGGSTVASPPCFRAARGAVRREARSCRARCRYEDRASGLPPLACRRVVRFRKTHAGKIEEVGCFC